MAQKNVKIRRNADGTVTLRIDRAVEHFSTDKPRGDLYDALRWAAISKGVRLEDETLIRMLREEGTNGYGT